MSKNLMEDIKLNKKTNSKNNDNVVSSSYHVADDIVVESHSSYITDKNLDSKINKFLSKKYPDKINIDTSKSSYSTNNNQNNKKRYGFVFFSVLIILILIGFYFILNLFEKTTINIIAKNQIFDVDKNITINKEANTPIGFDITIVTGKEIEKMTLTEIVEVSEKSKGQITLYNSFTTTPQKIIAGTFLADEEGKTYKLDNTITIPGYKLDKNKKILPGSVSASITAFLAGDTYNGNPDNFYITSFKGTNKYSKIYGKLKSPLTGGAVGTVYKLNDKERAKIDTIANTSFKNNLIRKAKEQVPDNYIVYKDAGNFDYHINDGSYFKNQNAEIEIEGNLSLLLIKKDDLSRYILKYLLPKINQSELSKITIGDLEQLGFSFSDKEQIISKDTNSLSFNLLGKVDTKWNPDINEIKSKLVGIHKDNVVNIFKADPTISYATIKIFPPWKAYVSSDLSDIILNIK